MVSVKEKFIQTLTMSDEGIEMMLQRTRRQNPNVDETEVRLILKKELRLLKNKSLPSYLKPVFDV